jgi:hypothetical protein
MAGSGGGVFVVDTSSIIEVRRGLMAQEPIARVTAVYGRLITLASGGVVRFPKGVIDEIKQGSQDHAHKWAVACDGKATPHHEVFVESREVLAEVPNLIDVNKTSAIDEADPYVAGLALKLHRDGLVVTVITEDRKDSPTRRRSAVPAA